MPKVFVTGGSGFLGGRLIEILISRGSEVFALARSKRAAEKVSACGAVPVMGDLDAVEVMESAMAGAQYVFHSAAKVDLWGNPADYDRVNIQGTENVILAAKKGRVPKLIHVSTEAVLLGGPKIVNADETWPYPKKPLGNYARTKGAAERAVLAANTPGFETVIVRPRGIWGAGDTVLLPRLENAVRQGKFMWIGGGKNLTSTCYVDNVCEGLILAASRGVGGEIYCVTDGEAIPVREYFTGLLDTIRLTPVATSIPFWLAYPGAAFLEWVWKILNLGGEPLITRAGLSLIGREITINDGKARRELGYVSAVSREEGLVQMVMQGAKNELLQQ